MIIQNVYRVLPNEMSFSRYIDLTTTGENLMRNQKKDAFLIVKISMPSPGYHLKVG